MNDEVKINQVVLDGQGQVFSGILQQGSGSVVEIAMSNASKCRHRQVGNKAGLCL